MVLLQSASQDEVKEAPTDIRHYEFIKYSLSADKMFIASIDNTLHNVFATRYNSLYAEHKGFSSSSVMQ